jgi:NAD(P)H-hydrate epimerase
MMSAICDFDKPAVFDAEALNVISQFPDILLKRKYPSVLTPHPGEMKRLLKGFGLEDLLEAERPVQASELAEKTNTVVVLKGNRTVIAEKGKPLSINSSGSPALATAGTGDVLPGMIGAFIAQGLPPYDASVCAVFIHGLAGENGKFGTRGLTADDLIGLIPETMKKISPFA